MAIGNQSTNKVDKAVHPTTVTGVFKKEKYSLVGQLLFPQADYNRAIEIDPDFATAHNSRKLVYEKLGNQN